MFAAARRLCQPKGVVKSTGRKFNFLEFQDGGVPKVVLMLPLGIDKRLADRDVAFEVVPSSKAADKTEARGVRLCEPKDATGKLKFFDCSKGFGVVVGKDGKESLVHHSHVLDFGSTPVKLAVGDAVEFDLDAGKKGPLAVNVRRST